MHAYIHTHTLTAITCVDPNPTLPVGASASLSHDVVAVSDPCPVSLYKILFHFKQTRNPRVLGVWLPAPLPTPRALPDLGALWPLAVGVEKDLGGIDV